MLNLWQSFKLRHCGLDPQSPEIGQFQGIPGQAQDDDLSLLV